MALQEIVTSTRPEVIVETGVAHGGSLVFSASLLALLGGEGRVVGVDIDIRPNNRERLETHPLSKYITLIEGSSIDESVLSQVREIVDERRVLVVLDSNHTHAHVLRELELYSPMVREGGYVVVFDTALEDAPKEMADDRPWGPGNSPRTAIAEFLEDNSRFQIDRALGGKLHITVSPDGYLKCIGDPP
jgi:cephalosporin hydroxylase